MAAGELSRHSNVKLVKLDGEQFQRTRFEAGITQYPVVRIYHAGRAERPIAPLGPNRCAGSVVATYDGPRSAPHIISWIRRVAKIHSIVIETPDEAEKILNVCACFIPTV